MDVSDVYSLGVDSIRPEIMDVRDATQEEKEHGHAHGVGGHQH